MATNGVMDLEDLMLLNPIFQGIPLMVGPMRPGSSDVASRRIWETWEPGTRFFV